jgi:hypothetical protein
MTRDDIIRMAQEAGFECYPTEIYVGEYECTDELERFAKLVAAAEREKIAQIIKDSPPLVAAVEREECAKVVEQAGIDGYGTLAAAVLVRERGKL